MIHLVNVINRNGVNTKQHSIPFSFTIKLPPLLKSGVDYGFKPSKKKI